MTYSSTEVDVKYLIEDDESQYLVAQKNNGEFIELLGTGTAQYLTEAEADTLYAAIGSGLTLDVPTVLKFGGDDPETVTPMSVYAGQFWPINQDLGPFSFEAWACIGDEASEYIVSEGHGGVHGLLFGFSPTLTGNIWDGITAPSFSGGYTAQVGEWLHARYGWDGTFLFVWVNGILVNITPFEGPRRAQIGTLYLGGSDHSNFYGKLAGVRMYEGLCPAFNVAGHEYIWSPPRTLRRRDPNGNGLPPAQGVWNFLGGSGAMALIHDAGDGFNGETHDGLVTNSQNGAGVPILQKSPAPNWVSDVTAPFSLTSEPARVRTFPAPTSAPPSSKIWDSVGRADSIPAFTSVTAIGVVQISPGSTESGSLGPKVWQHTHPSGSTAALWGVFDGTLFTQHENPCGIFVLNNSADMEVSVDRADAQGYKVKPPEGYNRSAVMLLFRYLDADNFLRTYFFRDGFASNIMRVYSRVAGVDTQLAQWNVPNFTWTAQKIVALGTTITAYIDGVEVGNVTGVTAHQTQVGVGLWSNGGTAMRAKNFRVA